MQDCIWNYLHLRPSGSILYVWTIVAPFLFLKDLKYIIRLPWWLCDEEPSWQCRRGRFNLQSRKILWWRKWQPSPVFLLGKSHGQRSLVGYSPWGRKRIGQDLATKQQQQQIYHHLSALPSFGLLWGDKISTLRICYSEIGPVETEFTNRFLKQDSNGRNQSLMNKIFFLVNYFDPWSDLEVSPSGDNKKLTL